MATMTEMVEAVKAHANAHWDEDGWDEIAESYEDCEIAEVLALLDLTTVAEAIHEFHEIAKLRKERGDEIRATAW